jgi:hypothetical protein
MTDLECLADAYPDFADFWKYYRDNGFSLKKPIPLPKDRINEMYVVRRFHDQYLSEPYYNEKEYFLKQFCSQISIYVVEILQKEPIANEIYHKFLLSNQNPFLIRTTSREDTSENVGGQSITRQDEPLLSTEDLLGKDYGSHVREDPSHARADWVRQVETHQPQINLTRKGLRQRKKKLDEKSQPVKDEQGNFVYETRNVNGKEEPVYEFTGAWEETEDRLGIAQLLRSYPPFEVDLSKYLFAYEIKRLFYTVLFPPGDVVYDPITRRSKLVIREEDEKEEEVEKGRVFRKTDLDDITEEEYNALSVKEPTYYRERLKRAEKRQETRIKKVSGATKQIEEDKLDALKVLVEAYSKKTPRVDVASFYAKANEVEGYETLKRAVERKLKTEQQYEKVGMKPPQLIICLLGDPGVGKSFIARVIAKALGRKLIKLACGGQDNPAFLKGNQPTFRGASFGQIVKGMVKWKTSDPVIMLDEAEKVKDSSVLDVISDITDRDQNNFFFDILLDFSVDLSDTIIILTMNNRKAVPKWLESRCTFIDIPYLSYQARKKLIRSWLTEDLTKLGLSGILTKIGDQLIECCITETWGMRETRANTLFLIEALTAMNVDNAVPSDLNTFSIDNSLPITRTIKYSNGQIIELQKKVDKKAEEDDNGKLTGKTLIVKTEISDWPGYTGRI